MLEKALRGSRAYWTLVVVLLVVIGLAFGTYLVQLREGLGITGLGRDVTWGFYIAQFTFMVGVAASAVMVVLPYYLHNFKAFGRVVVLGEFLAISAVTVCGLFIVVDMGQPMRVVNIFLHPTPTSPMFWDSISIMGYFVLNAIIAYVTFGAERRGVAPPKWIKPIIILSIPWAVSIHTVTAFLYAGLEARHFWMTAILAPRFLASAFASGPSLLILLCLLLRKYTSFDAGAEAIKKLGQIVTYAMTVSVFFFGVELFTALYSDIPGHTTHFEYLFFGIHGKDSLVPWMWISQILGVLALLVLLFPQARRQHSALGFACAGVVIAIWLEKGLGMIIAGFVPNEFHQVIEYSPTGPELIISVGVYAVGAFLLTVLYKIAVSVREELET